MENHTEVPAVPATPAQERLLRYARYLWSIPLRVATVILLLFLLTDSMLLAGLGVVVLEVGALCALIGMIATLIVVTQRRQAAISGDDPSQKTAFRLLGLLLSNFAVAGVYAYIGIAQIGTSISVRANSPSGAYVAEVSHLDEDAMPPYGQTVSLRPTDVPLKFLARTDVFRGYCESVPELKWKGDQSLEIRCIHPEQVAIQKFKYREVVISYPTQAPVPDRRSKRGRL